MLTRPLLVIVALLIFLGGSLAVARPSSGSTRGTRYVVQPGDTLWQIARERYNGDPRVGVWKIQSRNGLGGAALVPGTVLVLPSP